MTRHAYKLIGAFTIGFSVTAALIYAAVYLPWCKGDSCTVQGWLSTAGGLAAVGAAIPTVLYLARQVKGAEKHNAMAVGVALLPSLLEAKHVAALAGATRDAIRDEVARLPQLIQNDRDETFTDVRAMLKSHIAALKRSEFDRPGERFGVSEDRDSAVDSLNEAIAILDRVDPDDDEEVFILLNEYIPLTYTEITKFTNALHVKATQRYLMINELVAIQ